MRPMEFRNRLFAFFRVARWSGLYWASFIEVIWHHPVFSTRAKMAEILGEIGYIGPRGGPTVFKEIGISCHLPLFFSVCLHCRKVLPLTTGYLNEMVEP